MKEAERSIVVFVHNRDFFGTRLIHIPLFVELRDLYPARKIIVYAPFESALFYKHIGVVDQVRVYSKGIASLMSSLKADRPLVLINMRATSIWVALSAWLARVPVRISYKNKHNKLFMTHLVDRDTSVYRLGNYMELLAPLKAKTECYRSSMLQSFDIVKAAEKSTLLLMPGGGAGEFKKWPLNYYREVASSLQRQGLFKRVKWLLGPEEQDARDSLKSYVEDADILYSLSFDELLQEVTSSKCIIANDCGPSHLSHIMGVNRVLLFSDYDGDVQQRVSEWFLQESNSRVLVGDEMKGISSISPAAVEEAVQSLVGEEYV